MDLHVDNSDERLGVRYSRKLPQRELGTTGVEISLLGLGGVGILQEGDDDDQCVEIINEAIDLGINFIDTAPGYKRSEQRVGMVTRTRRDEVFLATKVEERTYDGIMRQIENSLKVLHTSQLDLVQIHHVYTADDVPAMGAPNGIFTALNRAKDEGMTRYIGLTGHPDYPKVQEALDLFDWDTFMCFINPLEFSRPAFDIQIPIARRKGMGLIGMKAYGGYWVAKLIGEGPGKASAEELLRYALTVPTGWPVDTVIPGVWNIEHLRENIEIARTFQPMSDEELKEVERKLNTRETA